MSFSARIFDVILYPESYDTANLVDTLESIPRIKDYAYILHDKDKKENGEAIKPHVHVSIRTKDSTQSKYVAKWFGQKENSVGKAMGTWGDMLLYMTHENAPEKFQYPVEDVISNFEWKSEAVKGNKGKSRIDEIVTAIANGSIREFNYHEFITPVEYTKYRRQIDSAFAYRTDTLKGVERKMDCIFITGESGSGKTTYAKQIAQGRGFSTFVSSGSNDLIGDYRGQECIILDDLRPSCIGLSDLLKMLDNHTASTVKSRYRNKVLECKLIIITTILDIDTFFKNVFENDNESCIQLKRRCETHITMNPLEIAIRHWLKASHVYGTEFIIDNPTAAMFAHEDLDEIEQIKHLNSILGGTVNLEKAEVKVVDFDFDDFPQSFLPL